MALPRTASTFTYQCYLDFLPNYELNKVHKSKRNKDFNRPVYMDSYLFGNEFDHLKSNSLTKLHCRLDGPGIETIKKFKTKNICLVRNLYDIIVSLYDHHTEIGWERTIFKPMVNELSKSELLDRLISYYIPRFILMYCSWIYAQKEFGIPIYFLKYEDFIIDKQQELSKSLDFYNIDYDTSKFKGNYKKDNFNKGVSGRGKEQLNSNQIKKIDEYLNEMSLGYSLSMIG